MGACCDSKPFGKPCGDCAFDEPGGAHAVGEEVPSPSARLAGQGRCPVSDGVVAHDSPVLADLAFGMASAAWSDADSAWAVAATARGVLARGTSGSDADRDAVLNFVDGVSRAGVVAGAAVITGALASQYGDPPWDYVWHRSPGYDEKDEGTGTCCPKKFCFPWKWKPVTATGGGGITGLGVRFSSLIEFKDHASDEDAEGCVCECCVYKQFVKTVGRTNVFGPKKVKGSEEAGDGDPNDFEPPVDGQMQEDCLVPDTGHRTGISGAPPAGTKQSDIKCFGSGPSWPLVKDKRTGRTHIDKSGDYNDTRDPCRIVYVDTPMFLAKDSISPLSVTFTFTGQIYDKCNSMKLVEEKTWDLVFDSTVPPPSSDADGGWAAYRTLGPNDRWRWDEVPRDNKECQ